MNKFLGSILIVFLVLVGTVSAAGIVDITGVTSVSGNPGESKDVTVTVTNTGNANLLGVNLVSSDLVYGSSKINAPTIGSISNLIIGTPQTKTFSVSIPSVYTGTYQGAVTATEVGTPANTDSFVYSVVVNPVKTLDVLTYTESNALKLNGEEKETAQGKFKIKNSGSLDLTSIVFTQKDILEDADNKMITLSFSDAGTIKPGEEKEITISAAIEDNIDLDTYSTVITVASGSVSDTFKLEVRVDPEVCSDGVIGDLNVDITTPDNGDDFNPGESISLEIEVDNNYNKDVDVIVEAFLYDVDDAKEIVRVVSESEEIEKDKNNYEFDLSLDVPQDEDMDEGDTYILYVKAYKDGDEDKHCAEDNIELELTRETHDVVIERFEVSPSTVNTGETVSFLVEVINVGTSTEDDVYVTLKESGLKLDKTSDTVDLKKYSSKDNSAIFRFTYTIPEGVEVKDYNLEAVVYFKDGKDKNSKFVTLKTAGVGATLSTFELSKNSFDVNIGSTFGVPFLIKNSKAASQSYTVEISSDFADKSTKSISVAANSEITESIYLTPKSTVVPGTYTATVTLKSDGNIVDTETVTVNIAKTGATVFTGATTGWFENKQSTTLFIIADVVLVLFAIFLLTLIFRRPKRSL